MAQARGGLPRENRRQRAGALLCVVLALLLPLWAYAAEPDEKETRRSLDRVFDGNDYQTELPGKKHRELGDGLHRDQWRPDRRKDREGRTPPVRRGTSLSLGPLGPIVRALLWVLVIAFGIVLVYWLAMALVEWQRRRAGPMAAVIGADVAPPPARIVADLSTIHGLFLDCYYALAERDLLPTSLALTPREALQGHRLDAETEPLFRELLLYAEIAVFAEITPGEAEFQRCQGLHRALLARSASASAVMAVGQSPISEEAR